jgi:hypothetical protein
MGGKRGKQAKAKRVVKDLGVGAHRSRSSRVKGGSLSFLPAVQRPVSTQITDGTSNTIFFGERT